MMFDVLLQCITIGSLQCYNLLQSILTINKSHTCLSVIFTKILLFSDPTAPIDE